MKRACEASGYKTEWIKASALIKQWHEENENPVPVSTEKTLELVEAYQDAGDKMRERDAAEVARAVMREIARRRAEATEVTYVRGEPVRPNNERRAYLIDSIRHPAEVSLLRRTYGNAFALVGVVCEESRREQRILEKYFRKPRHGEQAVKDQVIRFDLPGTSREQVLNYFRATNTLYVRDPLPWHALQRRDFIAGDKVISQRLEHETVERKQSPIMLFVPKEEHIGFLTAYLNRVFSSRGDGCWDIVAAH